MKDPMILEALNYATTYLLTPRPFRRYIRYSINLWSRANRCAKAWGPHEDNCKAVILDAARAMTTRRTAVVLGSGLLRDVPIRELSALFDTVVLVDLVHPASVRAWLIVKRLNNVRLIGRDLSGYDDLAAGAVPEPLGFLRGVPYLDLVVSANILSQIGTGTAKRLAAEAGQGQAMPDDTVPRLIRTHLEGLSALPCRRVLLTDVALTVIDRQGQVLETTDLLHGISPPQGSAPWDWPVSPFGEESRDYEIVHRVIAT